MYLRRWRAHGENGIKLLSPRDGFPRRQHPLGGDARLRRVEGGDRLDVAVFHAAVWGLGAVRFLRDVRVQTLQRRSSEKPKRNTTSTAEKIKKGMLSGVVYPTANIAATVEG